MKEEKREARKDKKEKKKKKHKRKREDKEDNVGTSDSAASDREEASGTSAEPGNLPHPSSRSARHEERTCFLAYTSSPPPQLVSCPNAR